MTATMLIGPQAVADRDESWLAARRTGISASEIAVVLGISPWQSPFGLYWAKVNGWELEPTDEMTAGLYLEHAIGRWWEAECDPLENLAVREAGLYVSTQRPWQLATPDRLIYMVCSGCDGIGWINDSPGDPEGGAHQCRDCLYSGIGGVLPDAPPVAVLELKYVAHHWDDGWGEPGTNEIPVHYLAQVQWQCDVMDVDTWYLAALGPGGFRDYHGRRDERDLRMMREAGRRFHERLVAGDPPPLDDAHTATIATLKKLHPSVSDVDVEVGVDLAEGYRRARAARARAESLVDRYEVRLRDTIGDGRRAMCNSKLVASRSVYDVKPHYREGHTVDRLNPGRSKTYA